MKKLTRLFDGQLQILTREELRNIGGGQGNADDPCLNEGQVCKQFPGPDDLRCCTDLVCAYDSVVGKSTCGKP